MKRNSRRCMNIPDYFLGKPYHKVVSRGEQIKPNLCFVRDGDACAFVRHPPRTSWGEKSARPHCEVHGDHISPVTPTMPSNGDHSDRGPPPKHTCGFYSHNGPEIANTQRPKKTKGNHKDNQKPPGATIPASPCNCTSQSTGTTTTSPLTHCPYYPPTPSICGMTCHQEHTRCSCHFSAPTAAPATMHPHQSMETPRETGNNAKCSCKRSPPPPRTEVRPSGCCCTEDAKSDSSLEFALSDDSASDSSVCAVVEDATEIGEPSCVSCHHYQLVCCCRHGVLHGPR